ncbi:serine/threonine-protein phosphatase 6 regulatory ankyrin repeat subunit B isoform X2 [Octopus sinensis]|uniref:Serine/threonine-protein phosphatase 6 regulatory ankyrin repeat subunit B isoform X2 n=1 Tax=Octopus sinensis TaxID=2607531 RepID=A0A7E6FT79_9MOLL|nr:serine/threonine-protein phosphatase 6 regulatory ankyrin repeat subunit B isoform X2 [Octopus sinensis]
MEDFRQKIRNGDVEGIQKLVKKDPTIINKPIDGVGRTPLMEACFMGADRRIIDILIKAGAKLGAKNRWGNTALHWAVLSGRPHAVEILLSRGSEVNLRDKYGYTPLHLACYRGNLHTVDLLLGHNGIDANVVANNGDTPLHKAVQKREYKVVCAMLKQDYVQFDIKNHREMTPLLLAVSEGHVGMVHQLIAKGADVNVVNNEGNNCLHLAAKTKRFHSEVEPLSILDKYLKHLKLGKKERYSDVVVACYLAHHGANFYCKNKIGRTPLDLIEKENLKKTLNMLFPPQCRWCQKNMATVRLQPCGDLVLCENCSSEMTFKRCPMCRGYTLSKSEFEAPKFEDRCVKKEATCQELGAASQAIESPVLKEKDLLRVAKRLGRDWWQIVIVLEVDTTKLKIDDESNVTVKQGYQILYEWFKNCDPETRTHATLRAALEEAECFAAMECLSLDAK